MEYEETIISVTKEVLEVLIVSGLVGQSYFLSCGNWVMYLFDPHIPSQALFKCQDLDIISYAVVNKC